MSLGSAIGSVVDAATGGYSGSSLDGFLSKFSDSQGRLANVIDPKNTFDVNFKFYPCLDSTAKKSLAEKIGAAAMGALKSATSNLVNNLTGGLVASLMSLANDSVQKQHDGYSNAGKYSFMNYLAVAEMHDSGEAKGAAQNIGSFLGGTSGSPKSMLEMDMSYFVQEITVPQLRLQDGGKADTLIGEFPVNGRYVMPENNELTFTFINTKLPIMETVIYPWMREVSLPYWSYDTQPYTTATITIDFSKHSDIQYVFCGCRPKSFFTAQPKQENGDNLTRQVVFMFDFMFITSKDLDVIEQPLDKLLSSGKALFNSATKMVNA